MKLKINITSIGAAVTCVLSLVSTILFAVAYNSSNGYFAAQYVGLPSVVGYGVAAMVMSIAVITIPMLNTQGLVKKILDIAVDVCIVLTCAFLILSVVSMASSSVYEMALTWASELHIDEGYMKDACSNALTAMIISAIAMLVLGVAACITKTVYAKKETVEA